MDYIQDKNMGLGAVNIYNNSTGAMDDNEQTTRHHFTILGDWRYETKLQSLSKRKRCQDTAFLYCDMQGDTNTGIDGLLGPLYSSSETSRTHPWMGQISYLHP